MKKLLNAYKNFHGQAPIAKAAINMHYPKGLVLLGQAVEIIYASDKKNGGGNGKLNLFKHKFAKSTMIYMDETKKQLYILGPKLKVTSAGIVN